MRPKHISRTIGCREVWKSAPLDYLSNNSTMIIINLSNCELMTHELHAVDISAAYSGVNWYSETNTIYGKR